MNTKGFARGAKNAAILAASGAGAYYLNQLATDKVDFIRNNWYAAPLVGFIAAVALSQRYPMVAGGVAGAAGLLAVQGYQANSANSSSSAGTDAQGIYPLLSAPVVNAEVLQAQAQHAYAW